MVTGARPPLLWSPRGASLHRSWEDIRRARPGIPARDAALALGVSEAELLASSCGSGVTRLAPPWSDLIADLPAVGTVVATTRNALAVQEKRGAYSKVDLRGSTGVVLNDAINLRLSFAYWRSAFAVYDGRRRSFEFFDGAGRAVHKVFLTPEGRGAVFETLVVRHASEDQSPPELEPTAADTPRPTPVPDAATFRERWALADDAEEADTLIANSGLSRPAALRLLAPSWAYPVGRQAFQRLLAVVTADHTPITIGVGNSGAVQRHTGVIPRVYASDRWLHIREISFKLRVSTDRIAAAWVVKTPSRDGLVSTLELFDRAGTVIAMAQAARWPGQMEPERWRTLLGRLPPTA